jgi:uncharacterized protein (TIGR03579 family)
LKTFENVLLKQWSFVILLGLASAAVFGATSMFINYHIGATNEIFVTELLTKGLETGDFQGATSFATGFLLARLLEAPLVGILDIGGSLLTGIGIGIPALILQSNNGIYIENFYLALLTGFVVGFGIGGLLIGLKKIMPENFPVAASGVLMGAGNKTGEALGPLVLVFAVAYSFPAGVGAIIGSLFFYKLDKPLVGGAILGAMLLSWIFWMCGLPIQSMAA